MYHRFDQEFRDNAVCLALEKKVKLNDLAKDLGIGRSTLSKWISNYRKATRFLLDQLQSKKKLKDCKEKIRFLKKREIS